MNRHRRAWLLALAACMILQLPSTAAHAAPRDAAAQWKFRVLLDDREIGFHDFRLTDAGGALRVETEASFDVRILFLNAYRYRHRNVEMWKTDCLTAIESTTDDNGSRSEVRGASVGNRFLVQTLETQSELPGCVMSFAYWNPRLLDADYLLNSQTGELQAVTVTPRGETRLRVNEVEVRARRYDLRVGDTVISLWYAADDYRWLALETPAAGSRTLRYEPVVVPPFPPIPATARAATAASHPA